jgi:metallo-beta-lactamase class B
MGDGFRTVHLRRIAYLALVLTASLVAQRAHGQNSGPDLEQIARSVAEAQIKRSLQFMNRPFKPFRLIGSIHYVGASDVSSFLITTPAGHVLIDTGFEATVPMIRDHVRQLGFRFEDIKVLLNSHAHLDHAGGHAQLKRLTGALIVMSQADAALLSQGGRGDFVKVSDEVMAYEPARADRIIVDGEPVILGGVKLTAHLTPGHTKGCTTWTMVVEEEGKRYDVVFFGGTTILPGVQLVNNPKYRGIVADFTRTFRTLKSLPCDVYLAPHGSMFHLSEKAGRFAVGETPNPFIDPEGYRTFIRRSEEGFLRQLERERRAALPRSSANP